MLGHVIWMLVSHLLSRGSMVFSGMLIARYLDKAAFASYSYLLLTATMIAIYSAMGIGITTTKSFAKLESQKSSTPIATLGIVNFSLAVITIVIFYIFNQYFIPNNLNIPILTMGAIILFMSLDIYASNALIGLEKFKQLACVSIVATVIVLVSVSLSIYNKNVIYSMYGLAFASFLQFILNTLMILKNLKEMDILLSLKFRYEHINEIFKTIGPMLPISLIAASGTWIIGRFILLDSTENGLKQFALFSIGLQWYSIALFLPTMISKVILPRLIKISDESSTRLLRLNCYIVFFGCLLFAIIGLISEPLISSFYGSEYNLPRGLIFSYLCAATISSPANIMGNSLIADDKELTWLMIVVCSFISIIMISNFALGFGAWLGALALSVSSLILILLSSLTLKRRVYSYENK